MKVSQKKTNVTVSSSSSQRALAHLFREYEQAREDRDVANARVTRFEETIRHLIDGVPVEDQRVHLQRLEDIRAAHSTRGGEVFGNVIALFKKDQRSEWTVSEVQKGLERSGTPADQKALYNVLNYLAKTGRIQRVGRGQYVVMGVGIEMERKDDGTVRNSEHYD